MKIAILSVAVLAFMQTILGLAVSACRWKYKVSCGCPDDPKHVMYRIRTAYTNCAEWHPLLTGLMLVNGMYASKPWALWLYPGVVAARCMLIAGLTTAPLDRPNGMRFVGAAGTFALSFVLSGLLIYNVLAFR